MKRLVEGEKIGTMRRLTKERKRGRLEKQNEEIGDGEKL